MNVDRFVSWLFDSDLYLLVVWLIVLVAAVAAAFFRQTVKPDA